MSDGDYVIGVDYGTASVRAMVVDAKNGHEIASAEYEYPRWKKGMFCDAAKNQFRQHPLDYIEGLEHTIGQVVRQVGPKVAKRIRAISLDTTGSTPVAVDQYGVPLALNEGFEDNPNAMFFLWKDHSAIVEADQLNEHAKKYTTDYLKYVGGAYSSEWFWAKLLYVLRTDKDVADACYSWVEHCDWMPFLLTGGNDAKRIKRGVCAAGHKALWAKDHGGLPSREFLTEWDPLFETLQHPLFTDTYDTDTVVGSLSHEWASRLGLTTDVLIGIGALDAHMGAVGGQIEPYYLSKVMGTSTCDMMIVPSNDKLGLVKGICGQVMGSIVPGMVGLEAGQSAFGDVYGWFQGLISETVVRMVRDMDRDGKLAEMMEDKISDHILTQLGKDAVKLPVEENSELAMDWFNGRRTPVANPYLKGAIFNLTLGSDAVRIYRSLVESTCFGARNIVEHFDSNNVPLKGIIALGGVARKSDYVMQTLANVLNLPIRVHRSEQTCAVGAAMFASVVAGIHSSVEHAMDAMGQGFEKTYMPEPDRASVHKARYMHYQRIGSFMEMEANKHT